MKSLLLQDVASVADHVRVEGSPDDTEVGFAERLIEGGGGPTTIESEPVPETLEQDIENVVNTDDKVTVSTPYANPPVEKPVPVQDVATPPPQ
jgi:hypothetical protein